MARILVFGADGMLGSALVRGLARGPDAAAHSVTACERSGFDIALGDWSRLRGLVRGQDFVLNAAGVINRRLVESALSWRVNAEFPHALAEICASAAARLIHFSTDCVFDGACGPHDEASDAYAEDAYGASKRAGEPQAALTLRCSIVGPELARFYNLLCWTLRQERIDGYADHRWNGVTTPALAAAVRQIIDADMFMPGLRHVHADDTDKRALIVAICSAFGHRAEIRAVTGRPRDTRLRTRHGDFLAGLRLPPIAAQIAALARCATPLGAWRDA